MRAWLEVLDDVAEPAALAEEYRSAAATMGLENALAPDEHDLVHAAPGSVDADLANEMLQGSLVMEAVLLWTLGRAEVMPSPAALADEGLLDWVEERQLIDQDFQSSNISPLLEQAQVRPAEELQTAVATYSRRYAELDGAEAGTDAELESLIAMMAAGVLAWVMDENMPVDGDFAVAVSQVEV